MRRAKIVCTLGPALSSYDKLSEAISAGLNVARLNMSHGDHDVHTANFNNVRRASQDLNKNVAILADIQGPKIRLETFVNGSEMLEPGDIFKITAEDVPGTKEICGTTYKGLPGDVRPGDLLLIDDGKVRLEATEVSATTVTTRVVIGGKVSDHKGINIPNAAVSVPALTEKDEKDLRWALRTGVDIIALSFVRSGDDILRVHEIMEEEGLKLPVIAKIEKPQAVDNLQDIIDKFDGIMVARGDLGVEYPLEEVPLVQKRAIELARRWAKPVIVATQVLESMISNPMPTRAEASDCANAILDGADAVMLSGETSVGQYPIITIQTMARIVESTEAHGLDRVPALGSSPRTRGGAVTLAAVNIAQQLDVNFICTFTQSGDSARRLCRLRPSRPILAFTPDPKVAAFMALFWGVQAVVDQKAQSTDEMLAEVDRYLISKGMATKDEMIVMTAGSPMGVAGSTNMVRAHRVGDLDDNGAPVPEEHEKLGPYRD
ncbi:pyruvate kinase [Rothia kristinae]|uniref:Pyruvate kinase n=1 Tax=Rothia kristinae TaxID=37923 RepID=A0A7T3CFQ3_9MICC|nr:pyruvate kinase [Rothia kristinae]TDP57198.1 pyruvate kinase [Kocuria sp. AG109]SIM72420.1 pyruvate kinase [Mycobacteroides abscessus subsp. abscessus]QPT53321.1 pyruvate kinase [Rothia kristinae]SQC36771.1 Pyruvate kinase [Rothia kristinae]SQC37937.1 Pyruvate kinase [Rothia kristinae]